ncbi:MAG: PilZ domain-containing protein [Candidatus Baltobacteraceae bacterium]
MLTGLLTWFSGSPENRRRYPRRTGGARAWVASEKAWTALGVIDVSASGMGVISPRKFEKDELNFRLVVEEKPLLVRAKQMWCTPGTLQGKPVWRYGVHYTGIAADDWDALVRFCSGGTVDEANKGQQDLSLIRMQADDVSRLIPLRLQCRLLEMLVQIKRLAPVDEKTPLVQYFYGGLLQRGGKPRHRLSIHSRIVEELNAETKAYDTQFYFDDAGNDIEMLAGGGEA